MFQKIFTRFISLKTLTTPNPNALKFISPEFKILPQQLKNKTFEFTSSLQSIHSPLALKLFNIPGVRSVMLGNDFLTVNKQDHINWANLTPEVKEVLESFSKTGQPTITHELINEIQNEEAVDNSNDSELVSMIKELIETRIRPAIQDDGGDIEFKGFDEETGNVFLKLQGACKSCSSSEDTLKNGIESMLKHYIEEVNEVIQILDPEEEIAMKEFEKLEQSLKKNKTNEEGDAPPNL
ncbi:unnamed protein product [Candida verbasci]|uniref:Scaffold protein Nfu/NifU N-terminal domain-containing protein n=1 Tax=Candida verbasci TaxID=1227364 RepID=A0A9W4XC37_9ASCO|nr:unnamed protein product [Candida verbasci]